MSQSREKEELVKELREQIEMMRYGDNALRVADFILSRTPPPASMKWPPELGLPYDSAYANTSKSFVDGFNKCLKACKELNAPKEPNNDAR